MRKTGLGFRRSLLLGAAGALILPALAGPAAAQTTVYEAGGFTLDAGVGLGLGYFTVQDANFGAGQLGTGERDVSWLEGYVAPTLDATLALGTGSLYGGVRVVASVTRGDGEPIGLTANEPERIDIDSAFVGWRSGTTFANLGEDAIDISGGRQNFMVGDGFLIADGNTNGSKEGTYWFNPHQAWANSAILRFNTNPIRGDVFWLRRDSDPQDFVFTDSLAGINLEYVDEKLGTVGGTFYQVVDTQNGPAIDGLKTFSLRGQGTPIAAVPDLFLAGEFAWQRNDFTGGDIESEAWYAEVGYTLSQVAWSPKLTYRYAHFSGDDPNTANTAEGFYNPYYGMVRGWGTWFQGEISGEYMFANTNLNSHMIMAGVAPLENLFVSAAYFRFTLDEPGAFGVTSDDVGSEYDIYVDWIINDNIMVSAVAGLFKPDDGGNAVFGGTNDDTKLFQVFAIVNF